MSVATRTGDDGTTALMFNRRLPKSHIRVETYGTIDELNSSIGLARAYCNADWFFAPDLKTIQLALVRLMGELATHPDDRARYIEGGYGLLKDSDLQLLDALVARFEKEERINFKGWATPGETLPSAALDVARTVCRRAERRLAELAATDPLDGSLAPAFLNRLSDLLWLAARWVESASSDPADGGSGGR